MHAPLTEVLAVIVQNPISRLPQARACATDNLRPLECGRPPARPDTAAAGKLRERYFFHRGVIKTVGESCIVHDPAIAHIDTMVQVAAPRRDDVRARKRLLVLEQTSVEEAHDGALEALASPIGGTG